MAASPAIQTRLAHWLAGRISQNLGTEVSIDRLRIDFINSLNLKGVLLLDLSGDTLLYCRELDLGIRMLRPAQNRYSFGALRLSQAEVNLRSIDSSGTLNAQFILDHFTATSPTQTTAAYLIKAAEITMDSCRFSYHNPYAPALENRIDFNHFAATAIYAHAEQLYLHPDSSGLDLQQFAFAERSGFSIAHLSAVVGITPRALYSKDLKLTTPKSHIYGSVRLLHQSWRDYGKFAEKVRLSSSFDSSSIALSDLAYFTSGLDSAALNLRFSGAIAGTLANLNGRHLSIAAGSRTVLKGNFDVSGLPDLQNAFMDIRIDQFTSDYNDLVEIAKGSAQGRSLAARLPEELKRAGHLYFEGSYTGFTQDFVAYGTLLTDAGTLDLDLNVESDSSRQGLTYGGKVELLALDMGRITASDKLGKMSASLQVGAFSREQLVSATLRGTIHQLQYLDYPYSQIVVDGTISSRRFSGELSSRDPNLNFDFQGLLDFQGAEPVLNFDARVYQANLTALNLVKLQKPFSFSTLLSLNLKGKSVNDMNGNLTATGAYLCYGDSMLYLDELRLTAAGDQTSRKISLTSDIADVALTGAFDLASLPPAFVNVVAQVLPSLAERRPAVQRESFDFSVLIKQPHFIADMLLPGAYIAPQSNAYGSFDSDRGTFQVVLSADSLAYHDLYANNVSVDLGKISEVIKARLFASKMGMPAISLQNFDADIEAYNDLAQLSMGWINAENGFSGELRTRAALIDTNTFKIVLEPGYIGSHQSLWRIDSSATVLIDSSAVRVDSLILRNGDQWVNIFGRISKNPAHALNLSIHDFDFESLDSLGLNITKPLQGVLNMKARISDFYRERVVEANLSVRDLIYDHYQIGNVTALSSYYGEEKEIALEGRVERRGTDILSFNGSYTLGSNTPLNATFTLDNFDLNIINSFNIPEVNDYSGLAHGNIAVKGTFDQPRLDGYIDFDRARFRIEYLNTYYTYSERVRIEDGWFGIDYKPIYDDLGHKGYVVASVFHDNYHNWSYDVSADVDNFFLLNTTREMNELYYGTAYGSGTVQIGGYAGWVEIAIEAKTDKGTSIKLPLDTPEDVTLENFVYFVNNADSLDTDRSSDLSGVQLRMNIDATTDAEVQLIFDERTGDIMRGRGSGRLTLEITPSGELTMFGRYEVSEGSYLFTLQNLINKQFQLRSGGTIGWYGDPYNADIDLTAYYSLRTPLYPVMLEFPERYRNREDVNVVLHLEGKLLNPNIAFEIELPQASETERSQLASAVSTTQQLNEQVFSLLILNRFLPVNNTDQNQAAGGVAGLGSATTSDFVSTQISNWLSEISDQFDIGLNYRPGDLISNQEIAVALSTQLFNERLSVSGNFGVTSASDYQSTGYQAQAQTGILGDFMVQYDITEDGKIRLRVFNETNPYQVFSTSSTIYTQGVGLIFQQEFDTLDEFFRGLQGIFTKDTVTQVSPVVP